MVALEKKLKNKTINKLYNNRYIILLKMSTGISLSKYLGIVFKDLVEKKNPFYWNSLYKLIKEKNISLDEIILFKDWKILFPCFTGNVSEDKILIQKHLLMYCLVQSLSIEGNQFMSDISLKNKLDKIFFDDVEYLINKQIIEKSYIIEFGIAFLHCLSKIFDENNEFYWINIRIILKNMPDLFKNNDIRYLLCKIFRLEKILETEYNQILIIVNIKILLCTNNNNGKSRSWNDLGSCINEQMFDFFMNYISKLSDTKQIFSIFNKKISYAESRLYIEFKALLYYQNHYILWDNFCNKLINSKNLFNLQKLEDYGKIFPASCKTIRDICIYSCSRSLLLNSKRSFSWKTAGDLFRENEIPFDMSFFPREFMNLIEFSPNKKNLDIAFFCYNRAFEYGNDNDKKQYNILIELTLQLQINATNRQIANIQQILNANIPPISNNNYQPIPNNNYQPIPNNNYQSISNNNYQPISNNNYQPISNNNYQPIPNNNYQPIPNNNYQQIPNNNYQQISNNNYRQIPNNFRPIAYINDNLNGPPKLIPVFQMSDVNNFVVNSNITQTISMNKRPLIVTDDSLEPVEKKQKKS